MKKFLLPAFLTAALTIALAPAASAAPHVTIPNVPSRTAITVDSPAVHASTANANEARPGLSTVKLYIADYALNHGDGSAEDRALAERAIRYSDDNAALQLYNKYPNSINATANNYGLSNTHGASHWGNSTTSTNDTAKFLEAKKKTDPNSPVLRWMETAAPVAADGTHQNWGTTHAPGVTGTKWGWSDTGPSVVASASIAPGYSIAMNTHGTPADQNADLGAANIGKYVPSQQAADPVQDLSSQAEQAVEAVQNMSSSWMPETQSLRSAVEEKAAAVPEIKQHARAIPEQIQVPVDLVDMVPNVPALR